MNTGDIQGTGAILGLAALMWTLDWLLKMLGVVGSIATSYYDALFLFTEYIYGAWTGLLFLSFFVGLVFSWSLMKNWRQGLPKIAILVAVTTMIIANFRMLYVYDLGVPVAANLFFWGMGMFLVPIVGIAGTIYGAGLLIRLVCTAIICTGQAIAAFVSSCIGNIYNAIMWSAGALTWVMSFSKPKDDRAREQNHQGAKDDFSKKFWEAWFADQARKNAQDQQQQKAREKSGKRQTRDDFDPSRFGAGAKPYFGEERMHPKDAKLWAVCHDEKAPQPVRDNAWRRIQINEQKRLGKGQGGVSHA